MTEIDTDKLSTRANSLDVLNFREVLDETDVLRHNVEVSKERLGTVGELSNDLFNAMFQYSPEVKPTSEIDVGFRHNKGIVERAMGTQEYDALRSFTKINEYESAVATASVLKNLLDGLSDEDITRMQEESKDAQSIEDSVQALRDTIEGLEHMKSALGEDGDEDVRNEVLEDAKADLDDQLGQLEALEEQIQETSDAVGQAVRMAVRKGEQEAKEEINETADFIRGWGTQAGDFKRMPSELKMKIAGELKKNEKLKKIARLIGKLKRIALSKNQQKAHKVPEEIVDTTMGDDLSHILPSELLFLDDPDLEPIFLKKFTEKRLLQYELDGKEKVGMGAIVCCVDCSGSMSGDREVWAKALMGGLFEIAGKEKRDFATVFFGSTGQFITYEIPYTMKGEERIDEYIKMMEFFFNGGTDFETPLDEARRIIEKKTLWKKADILMITDGECEVSQKWLDEFLAWKRQNEVMVQGILIGRPTEELHKFCDLTYTILDLLDEKENGEVTDLYKHTY